MKTRTEEAAADWTAVKDSFGLIMALAPHELVGPLNQASALIALFAKKHASSDGEETAALLAMVEAAAERMQATVTGLRGWFDVTGLPLRREPVSMTQVLHMAMYFLDREIKRTQATVQAGELPEVDGDASSLVSLIQILLANAMKFSKPGVPPKIGVSAKWSDGAWVFSVADNGIGIDPEYRARLFRPFKKLNGHSYPGAGMGLSTAKTIVDLHGGSIWIDSPGDGAAVSFSLSPAV
jgi:light-regulated signal transduction histidine kinase (bacteriophytochrome)